MTPTVLILLSTLSTTTAEGTVESGVNRVLEVLRDPSLQAPDKRSKRHAKLRSIADELFDWEEMAKRSLGVKWRDLSEEQRSQYIELFEELLASEYMTDLDRFKGTEKVFMDGTEGEGKTRTVKTTVRTHSREMIPMHYFLHQEGHRWLIHDVSIEGVSLVNHYRTSFRRFLVNKSFDQLLEVLERKRQAISG